MELDLTRLTRLTFRDFQEIERGRQLAISPAEPILECAGYKAIERQGEPLERPYTP